MNAEFYSVCDRLLSAVLNGLGQGLLLLLVPVALLKLFRTNAATRHGLLLATLVLLAILPLAQLWPLGETETPVVNSPSLAIPAVANPTADEVSSITTTEFALPLLVEADTRNTAVPNTEISPATSDEPSEWTISLPTYFSAVLVIAWGVVSVLRLGFLVTQLLALRSLKRNSLNAPAEVRELFSRLCVELEVSRAPQLRVTKKVSAPMAVGFKEPAVLLPEELCTNATNLRIEQILRHELAHVVRRDDWANLLQQTIRALFFFHPGIIWTSRRLTVDREIACDDHVLSVIPDRKSYALSLTEFASRSRAREEIAAPAGWSNDSQLKQRINMILDTKRNASPRLARGKAGLFAAAALIAAALAFQATPRLAFAQDKPELPPAEPATEAATAEPQIEVSISADADPAPESKPRVKAVIAHPVPVTRPGNVAIGATPPASPRPPRAIIAPRGQLFAVADPAVDEPAPGPARAKSRARANNQDSLEQRMDRLESMVESLVRQNKAKDKNSFQFEQRYDFKPGSNFNQNKEDWEKFHAKVQKETDRAAKEVEKAMKDMKLHGDFDGLDKTKDELKAHRKALEEQKRALDKQMQALQSQIQKLERDQERMSEEKERRKEDQKRRERDEEKGRADDNAKEKPEKP